MYLRTTFACAVDAAPEAAWALVKYIPWAHIVRVKRSRKKN